MNNLFHYTDAAAVKNIIETGELHATHFSYLNDKVELRYAFEQLERDLYVYLREEFSVAAAPLVKISSKDINWSWIYDGWTKLSLQELQRRFSRVPTYVLSFSKHEPKSDAAENGLLSQWRAYAKNGGCCIVFKPDFDICDKIVVKKEVHYGKLGNLEKNADAKKFITACSNYFPKQVEESKREQMKIEFNRTLDDCARGLFELIAFTKHPAFEEEDEYRFAWYGLDNKISPSFRVKADTTFLPYLQHNIKPAVSIDKIIVGPGPDQDRRQHSLTMLLQSTGMNNVEVIPSNIPLA